MFYKIRDSVDVYTIRDNILMFYFINTRRKYEYSVSKASINLISLIDGKHDVDELTRIYNEKFQSNIKKDSVQKILDFLISINVLVEINPTNNISNSEPRFERQINFLSELSLGFNSGVENQEKIENCRIAIFGIGAIGGDMALLLAMAGVKEFSIMDSDVVSPSDIARHMYFREEYIGMSKVEALSKELNKINSEIKVHQYPIALLPNTEIDAIINHSDFVINTADEPYIGYTSLKISEICCQKRIPHYIGGGFDIHVMSTGELIIPGKTPCVNCYTQYFKRTLADWKPENKKVIDKHNEYGGLSSQSLFSASYAVIQIIKYICGFSFESEKLTRGEVDFETYEFQFLNVEKNPNCKICGGIVNETKD